MAEETFNILCLRCQEEKPKSAFVADDLQPELCKICIQSLNLNTPIRKRQKLKSVLSIKEKTELIKCIECKGLNKVCNIHDELCPLCYVEKMQYLRQLDNI